MRKLTKSWMHVDCNSTPRKPLGLPILMWGPCSKVNIVCDAVQGCRYLTPGPRLSCIHFFKLAFINVTLTDPSVPPYTKTSTGGPRQPGSHDNNPVDSHKDNQHDSPLQTCATPCTDDAVLAESIVVPPGVSIT